MPPTTTTASPFVEIDAEALRERRQLRGETQASLADKAGLTENFIWLLESGGRRSVKPPAFARLCDALGLRESQRATLRKRASRTA